MDCDNMPTNIAQDGTVPDFEAASDHVREELVRFARRLRAEVSVPANASTDAARAIATIGLNDRARVRAALSAALISSPEGRERFEALFPIFWTRLRSGLDGPATTDEPYALDQDRDERALQEPTASTDTVDRSALNAGEADDDAVLATTDRREVTNQRITTSGDGDRRTYSAVGEGEVVDEGTLELTDPECRAIDRLATVLATIPGRRDRTDAAGSTLDARRTLRASLRTGGVPIELRRREAPPIELRCRLLVDVSRSVLDTLDRDVLLSAVYRLHDRTQNARTFLFDTDLREVTATFDRPEGDPAAALQAAETRWGGGTKIGVALNTLRKTHPTAIDRRTVVIVVSDGLDVGDADRLETEMAWVARKARAVVWLNPLAKYTDYEPTCRGMATALPYVDGLFAFASPTDLSEVARQLEQQGMHGQIGYEYGGRKHTDRRVSR